MLHRPLLICVVVLLGLPVATASANETNVKALPTMHTFFLLDRSGSMTSIRDDVIGGINQYVKEQQDAATGEDMLLTMAQFDTMNNFELMHDAVNVKKFPTDVPFMDRSSFKPRSGTPLYDAIGAMINHADKHTEKETAERVVVVIFSDGAENSSREFSKKQIFDLISERQKNNWAFVFLGANQDSYAAGGGLGITGGNTQNYAFDGQGVTTALRSLSRASMAQRKVMQEEFSSSTADSNGAMPPVSKYDNTDFFMGLKESEA